MTFNRRQFCRLVGISSVSVAVGSACHQSGDSSLIANDGRLTARPHPGVNTTVAGQIRLGLNVERDAILQIPKSAGQSPLPLLILLHGATQSAEDMFWYLGSAHEEAGVAVLAPNSRDTTWDAIGGSFGPDVSLLNSALERAFERVAIDPARVAIGGFSDGASYALALGLTNADLFPSVVGFSPGFLINVYPHGRPRFFISHGTRDHILPIDRCGRRLAAGLVSFGYDVTFREFDGDHEIPAEVASEALRWVAGP